MDKYEVVDGKMPEEFHQKHLVVESIPGVTIQCNNCSETRSIENYYAPGCLPESVSFEQDAARQFYEEGWRYCLLEDYDGEGVYCPECIEEQGSVENDTLQQPWEKTHDHPV